MGGYLSFLCNSSTKYSLHNANFCALLDQNGFRSEENFLPNGLTLSKTSLSVKGKWRINSGHWPIVISEYWALEEQITIWIKKGICGPHKAYLFICNFLRATCTSRWMCLERDQYLYLQKYVHGLQSHGGWDSMGVGTAAHFAIVMFGARSKEGGKWIMTGERA